jgi:hypothetical protein
MEKCALAIFAGLLAAALPARAADDPVCKLCLENREQKPKAPLEIEVHSGLDFSRLALSGNGGGAATIDAQTGAKFTQGNMIDLGGSSYQGRARVTGEPYAMIRIEMPSRVTLYSASGARIELNDFRTDLPSLPVLDGNGALEFNFGAKLETQGGQGGNFRGRIPIHVEYS